MAAGRSFKSLVSRRRGADEEGEDDEGPVMVEDSQSEGEDASALSDAEDDEADASSLAVSSAAEGGAANSAQSEGKAAGNGAGKNGKGRKRPAKKHKDRIDEAQAIVSSTQSLAAFKPAADTEAMLNGLKIADKVVREDNAMDFENIRPNGNGAGTIKSSSHMPVIASSDRRTDSPGNRQRREHEDYRRKRDADPAFIPNRGNFFMHDNTRSHHGQSNPLIRSVWSGRGRGRGGGNAGAPFMPINQVQPNRPTEPVWKHDLHDTINEEPGISKTADMTADQMESARLFPRPNASNYNGPHAKLSFSSTTLVGKVQIRVLLPGMKAPITFSEVPWKQYTRLPDHRPPLRRDKPVRISLPEHVQRYIFPSQERSFIFIPRQMRPNQQGLGGANRYQRRIGGVGYSSRRTSMYGGSMYAGSIAPSRRSSFASVARDNAFSPVGSFVGMPPTRPVIRLPHGAQPHFSASSTPLGPLSGHQTPTGMQVHTFPLPAQPQYQGTPTTTVHQPRPQKAISVTGIESPAILQQAQDQQPFANQLPAHMTETPQLPPPYFSPRQQYPYAPAQTGTPLSGIPEQAIHAPSFQPPMMSYGPGPYYTQYSSQQPGYYYPSAPGGYPAGPMYVPPQQNYMLSPPSAPPMPPQHSSPQQQGPHAPEHEHQQHQSSQSQSGMVAHESNGMVFYMPASEASQESQGDNYQPAEGFVPSYAMPGLPPPTPAPEQSYYYPPQMPMTGYYAAQ